MSVIIQHTTDYQLAETDTISPSPGMLVQRGYNGVVFPTNCHQGPDIGRQGQQLVPQSETRPQDESRGYK
jgi:hypothetical protein